MDYWYINTEAKDFGGKSPHKQWLKHGRAFVSGVAGKSDIKFARKLQQVRQGDMLFMYANTKGVVAVGTVLEPCNGYAVEQPLIYNLPHHIEAHLREYQVMVQWFLTLEDHPISPREVRAITGSFARQAVQRITDPARAKRLLDHARQLAGEK